MCKYNPFILAFLSAVAFKTRKHALVYVYNIIRRMDVPSLGVNSGGGAQIHSGYNIYEIGKKLQKYGVNSSQQQ